MNRHEAEELLAKALSEEPMKEAEEDAELKATKQLPPRWEVRIQAKHDPVVEETKAYRAMAREVDDRYNRVKLDTEQVEEEPR